MEIYFQKAWVDLMVKKVLVLGKDKLSVPENVLSPLVVIEKRSCLMDLAQSVTILLLYQVMEDNVRCPIVNSMKELIWTELVLNVSLIQESQVTD